MLCHLQSISCALIVIFQGIKESLLETTEPSAISYLYVKYCKSLFCLTYNFYQRVQLNDQKYPFHSLCVILCWHSGTACRQRTMRLLLNTHLLWSVFRWNMNGEQAMEVSHSAHESLFVMIEQLQMPHSCTPGCENILAVTASWLICVCGFC